MFILLSIYHAYDRAIIIRMIEELHALQRRRRPDLPVRPVWYRVQTGAACPASGLRSALVLARPGISGTACAAACAAQPFRVRWSGQGSPPAGHIAAALPRPVSPVTTEKIKKTHPTFTKRNPSDCASRQKFQKIQKDPFRSLDCGIIS